MIPELGHFALALACIIAVVQSVLPVVGAARRDARWMATAAPLALGLLLAVGTAFGSLLWAYAVNDTTVANVVANSHSAKPLIYKISGTWGNHEGSMVLWVLILAVCGAAVALFGRDLPTALKARVIGVLGWIAVGFLLFIILTSNPFDRVWPPPADGRGLNPVLQDPGLAMHPPTLYLGYVGYAVTFAFAIAALLEGRVDAAWGRWVRPWALGAWCFLTVGITMGSWWAYYELGWGGYWFWDPVENASLLPWLAGTALLHSSIVVEKRDTLKVWSVLLAILAFAMSLLGTFLVRSGVLNSVHAFANDPTRGVFILALLMIYVAGAFALFAWRAPKLTPTGIFAPISREGALVVNNLLLCSIAAVVLAGTLWPMFADILTGAKISVGPPFFNMATAPLAIPLVVAMPIGAMMPWKRGDLWAALQRLWWAAAAALLVGFLVLAVAGYPVWPALGMAMAAWLVMGAAADVADRIGLFRRPAQAFRRGARPAARGLGGGHRAWRARHLDRRHRRHGGGDRYAGAAEPRAERAARRLRMAHGWPVRRDRAELSRPPRHRDGAARRRGGDGAAPRTPHLHRRQPDHRRRPPSTPTRCATSMPCWARNAPAPPCCACTTTPSRPGSGSAAWRWPSAACSRCPTAACASRHPAPKGATVPA